MYISNILALNRLCKWSFCLFPSHSLRLFTILLGAFRDPLHCFVWMSLKDNGSLEPWPALSVCESASFHWECCPPMSREVMWSMCDWRGFPPLRVGASRRGAYIVWTLLSACTRPVGFYRSKRVKTTHCICFNVSLWLLLQGWHSQVTSYLETAGRTHNQFFTHKYWVAVEGGCLYNG